jgi:hypothetical protein
LPLSCVKAAKGGRADGCLAWDSNNWWTIDKADLPLRSFPLSVSPTQDTLPHLIPSVTLPTTHSLHHHTFVRLLLFHHPVSASLAHNLAHLFAILDSSFVRLPWFGPNTALPKLCDTSNPIGSNHFRQRASGNTPAGTLTAYFTFFRHRPKPTSAITITLFLSLRRSLPSSSVESQPWPFPQRRRLD